MFCITCEEEIYDTHVAINGEREYHWKMYSSEYWPERELTQICFGPFTTCPPPPIPDNWEEYVQEPSPEEMEMEMMDNE